jgi:hypothetical protein
MSLIIDTNKDEPEFVMQGMFYFTAFVCMQGTFLPYRYWILPVVFFYSVVYWVGYAASKRCDEPM